jgi:hypothetical protein
MSRFSLYGWMKQVERAATGDGPSPTSGPAPAEIDYCSGKRDDAG